MQGVSNGLLMNNKWVLRTNERMKTVVYWNIEKNKIIQSTDRNVRPEKYTHPKAALFTALYFVTSLLIYVYIYICEQHEQAKKRERSSFVYVSFDSFVVWCTNCLHALHMPYTQEWLYKSKWRATLTSLANYCNKWKWEFNVVWLNMTVNLSLLVYLFVCICICVCMTVNVDDDDAISNCKTLFE